MPLNNGFWILDEALVQFDTYSAELSLMRSDEVALYGRAFERLAALAVYGGEARMLIARALEHMVAANPLSKTEQIPWRSAAKVRTVWTMQRGDFPPRRSPEIDLVTHGDRKGGGRSCRAGCRPLLRIPKAISPLRWGGGGRGTSSRRRVVVRSRSPRPGRRWM